MIIRKLFALLVLSLLSIATLAQAQESGLGPDIGTKIPHDLSLMGTSGEMENFDRLKGDKGLAIFFTRSFDWCPFCQTQAKEVNAEAAAFRSRGFNPIFISYDTPEIQKNFTDRWEFTMPLLSDTGLEAIKAFGVLNENTSESSPLYGYPHPIVFLVDTDGVIQSKLYIENEAGTSGSSYRDRPGIDVILKAIDEMNNTD